MKWLLSNYSSSSPVSSFFNHQQATKDGWLLTDQPDGCGYPGFSLACKNETIIRFPFSGKFKVEILDYMWQYIWISDPSDCIAERGLQGFDLSGTPLELLYLQSFTILNYSSGTPIPHTEGQRFPVVIFMSEYLDNRITTTWREPNCQWCESLPSNAERGTAMLVAAAGNSICFCIIGRIIKRVTAIIVRIPTLKSLTHQQP
ncbi:hypothetical protein QQP08_009540 [Theobroma cacao]|nr:hypothetical protein QQP08_009540 [Theobroma cacao]